MMTIKGTVRDGRIEVENPIDFPNGTEVSIVIPNGVPDDDEPTPEEIADWIQWLDSFEPVELTEKDLAVWRTAQAEDRRFELEQWDRESQKIEKLFP